MNNREIQRILNQLGINIGKVDGIVGKKTIEGIKTFQSIFGLTVDGIPGIKTKTELKKLKNVANFKVQEFACKHCKVIKLDSNLLIKLEELRKTTGPLIITSGYRCPTHNKRVGGAKGSLHLKGKAADIKAIRTSANNVYKDSIKVFYNGGVGKYNTFTHVDVRGYKARF